MTTNLFAGVPKNSPEELVHLLLETPRLRIERIVSTGAKDPTHARFASLLVKSISSEWSWPLATLQSERGCIRDSHEW